MKITDVETIWLQLPEINTRCDGTQDTLLVRVHTDEGLVGVGEVDSSPMVAKAAIEAPMSHAIARGLKLCVLGQNPLEIERCHRLMYEGAIYFGRGGVTQHAISGIDMALWDLAGKAYGKPVYQLLGGAGPRRFRAYASILFGDTPDETRAIGERWVGEGFTAVKFGWGPLGQSEAGDLAHIENARLALGDAELMIDAGLAYDTATAVRRAQQFAQFNPYWFEEPLHPDNLEGYARLVSQSPIRIAAGEQEVTYDGMARLIDTGIDVVQPDFARIGGPTMAMQIGRLTARKHRLCVNHTYKSGVSVACALHVLAALPNTSWFEYCVEQSPIRWDVTTQKFPLDDSGYVHVTDEPGLGIELNEDTLAKYRVA